MNITSPNPFGPNGLHWIEIMIIIAILGLLGYINIPYYIKTHTAAEQKNTCIKHLKQIEVAKATFVRLNQETNGETALCKFIYDPKNFVGTELVCPAGGIYTINPVGVPPTCSIPEHALPKKTP